MANGKNSDNHAAKRVNFGAMVGDMAAKKGERITDAQSQKLLNTEQVITVSLSKIYVSAQIRLQIHQDKVNEIAESFPLRNYPEIRMVDEVIDGNSVPAGFEYVLLTGEHRFRALEQLKIEEYQFKFVPPSQIKTKADVIKYQYAENNIRADMHIIEKAKALKDYMTAADCNQGEAGKALSISTTLASRLQRISKYLTDEDSQKILELNIKSERVVVGITRLIELGITSWPALITDYVLAEHGKFDPELIYESTLNQIVKDLTNKEKTQQEITNSVAGKSEAPNSINPTETLNSSNGGNKASISNEERMEDSFTGNDLEIALGHIDAHSNTTSPDKISLPLTTEVTIAETTQTKAIEELSTSPASPLPADTVEKRANFKLVFNILQKVVEGKPVPEILKELGSEIKTFISEEDGRDIYEIVHKLSFDD